MLVGVCVWAEGDLAWCGIWHEGNGSALGVGKLSVKCCHCIKACLCEPGCVCVCVRTCVCVVRMSLYDIVSIYASLSWGYWSWEQHAESSAADRKRQLNMSLCWMSWVWNNLCLQILSLINKQIKCVVCCKFVVGGVLSNHVSGGFGVCRMAVCTMSKSRRNAIRHHDIPAPIGVNLTLIYLSP